LLWRLPEAVPAVAAARGEKARGPEEEEAEEEAVATTTGSKQADRRCPSSMK
jgi:hypothetical protein